MKTEIIVLRGKVAELGTKYERCEEFGQECEKRCRESLERFRDNGSVKGERRAEEFDKKPKTVPSFDHSPPTQHMPTWSRHPNHTPSMPLTMEACETSHFVEAIILADEPNRDESSQRSLGSCHSKSVGQTIPPPCVHSSFPSSFADSSPHSQGRSGWRLPSS